MRAIVTGAAAGTVATGWYDPRDPDRSALPRVQLTTAAVNPKFATALVPLPAHVPEPSISTTRSAGAVEMVVAWPDRTDTITWPASGAPTVTIT